MRLLAAVAISLVASVAQAQICGGNYGICELVHNGSAFTQTGDITCSNANGPRVECAASSATNPTFVPDRASATAGIGGTGGDVSIITNGAERVNFDTAGIVAFKNGITVRQNNDAAMMSVGEAGTQYLGISSTQPRFSVSTAADAAFALGTISHTDVITFCGQGPNGATTTYLSPRIAGLFGDATCDAEDNTTEATADEVWAPYDFRASSMVCGCTDAAVDTGLTFAFRDDTADASTDLTCTSGAGDGAGFVSCADMDTTPPTVAAGSAIAMRIVAASGNFSAADCWCRLTITN